MPVLSALRSLGQLKEGNRRFAAGEARFEASARDARHARHMEGQEPFAVILGCSDSRVPVEIIFDQGFGDLFVVRVAGNIVGPTQIGSVEFAAERFGTRLVVVLGHSRCGAVQATLDELKRPESDHSPNLRSIVDRIQPHVEKILRQDREHDEETLLRLAVQANVLASVAALRHGSDSLEQMVRKGRLLIVGAKYSLDTGVVEFLDGADPR
jgi:carbonic anhydrase